MADNKLEISLEQRDWERLQKLSERNGEPKENLVKRILAAELADLFNQPTDIVISPEARRIYDSFVAGRTQHTSSKEETVISEQEAMEPAFLP